MKKAYLLKIGDLSKDQTLFLLCDFQTGLVLWRESRQITKWVDRYRLHSGWAGLEVMDNGAMVAKMEEGSLV